MKQPVPLFVVTPARLGYTPDGTPYSTAYDDIYHSPDGGLGQVQHVFLNGNQLPQRWQGCENFTILETGFGLGLSFLATWQAWRDDPQRSNRLHFVSTELHPFNRNDLATLHLRWPELAERAAALQAQWPPLTPGFHHLLLDDGQVTLTLLFGDAPDLLPQLQGKADAIYLDGFAPTKNPALWSTGLLAAVTQHATVGATLATWCVTGEVRAALKELGWALKRREGFATKWHMLTGSCGTAADIPKLDKRAIVIGAGIAGCSMVEALTRRDWQVTLIEQHASAAEEASGNPAGLLHPMLARDDNTAARLSRAGHLYSLRLLQRLSTTHPALQWQACGILEVAENDADAAEQRMTLERLSLSPDYVSWLDQANASERAGLKVGNGALWFAQGAWVNPPSLCNALLAEADKNLSARFATTVTRIDYDNGLWHSYADEKLIASAPHLILANAAAANRLLPHIEFTLRRIRGQISEIPAAMLAGLQVALCGSGYVTPPHNHSAWIGASFVEEDDGTEARTTEHTENLAKLNALLPDLPALPAAETLNGRVSFRSATHDRVPLVGQIPTDTIAAQNTLDNLQRQPGLHGLLGLGSRGLIWGPIAAEALAAKICGEVLPLDKAVMTALDPARFQLRKVRKEPKTL